MGHCPECGRRLVWRTVLTGMRPAPPWSIEHGAGSLAKLADCFPRIVSGRAIVDLALCDEGDDRLRERRLRRWSIGIGIVAVAVLIGTSLLHRHQRGGFMDPEFSGVPIWYVAAWATIVFGASIVASLEFPAGSSVRWEGDIRRRAKFRARHYATWLVLVPWSLCLLVGAAVEAAGAESATPVFGIVAVIVAFLLSPIWFASIRRRQAACAGVRPTIVGDIPHVATGCFAAALAAVGAGVLVLLAAGLLASIVDAVAAG